METPEFQHWGKIPRLRRTVTVTEKIDGTNACVGVTDSGEVFAQSRNRIITPDDDNFGFARWVAEHELELAKLGPGHHFGEWYGLGIQRGYGLDEKRFALFNTRRWSDESGERPDCCEVVPVLAVSENMEQAVTNSLYSLDALGSRAVSGFGNPEGIVVFHHASRSLFKVLLEGDDLPKGQQG